MANEKRLIDANALMKRFYNYYDCVNEFTSKNGYRGDTLMDYEVADMIYDCIDNAPTVDAVEVVRCKDCKYINLKHKAPDGSHLCDFHTCTREGHVRYLYAEDNDFCSCGERREGK